MMMKRVEHCGEEGNPHTPRSEWKLILPALLKPSEIDRNSVLNIEGVVSKRPCYRSFQSVMSVTVLFARSTVTEYQGSSLSGGETQTTASSSTYDRVRSILRASPEFST